MPRLRALCPIRMVVYRSLVPGCTKLRSPGPASMYFNPPTQVDFSGSKSWAGNFLQNLWKKFW